MVKDLILFFVQYVKESAREHLVKTLSKTSIGTEIASEIQSISTDKAIANIDLLIISINADYVSKVIRDYKQTICLVEYNLVDGQIDGRNIDASIAISISIITPILQQDLISECIALDDSFSATTTLIKTMIADYNDLEHCPDNKLITQFEIIPIDPSKFYGRSGWTTQFTKSIKI